MDAVLLSLVVPTYNRAAMLAEALASVARSRVTDAASVEVVVVDNNSTDNTAAAVERIKDAGFPFALRYVFEPRQGSSAARNAGISRARGVYVVFMDDDQRIEENYLRIVAGVFIETEADCVGGPVRYFNAAAIPPWLTPLLEHVGQFDAGGKTRPLFPPERMLGGGNMAITSQALAALGGFDETLGRRGSALLANEDREIQERLCAAGRTVFYSPKLIQYHYLRPERLTKRYWWRNRFDWGRTLYRQDWQRRQETGGARLFGAPRWFWWSLALREAPGYARSMFSADSATRFHRQLEICVLLGKIHEARVERRVSADKP